MMHKSCPFCDTSEQFRHIAETETMRVIYPYNPVIKNHFLICPKKHKETFDMLNAQELADVGVLTNKLLNVAAPYIEEYEGYNIQSNNGSVHVNQQVKHAHIHLFMRSRKDRDPFTATHTEGLRPFTDDQLDYIACLKKDLLVE